ncbi:hypothetical protein [Belnapia rosea]|uniref:hypothetical protein n=1 Tax=Belnapia rosea TaxID=938405 RepID=UPI000882FF01|nr:hypothetical protein [Belnapia rosea]SDB06639.1 Membrane-anchored ribosome-binding protein, inhibits growth in stationary phase, ElaB/YqjD/DUF883 family [Belnapia rosea]
MSEKRMEGSGAAAVGAHSKDAMQSGSMPGGRPQGIDPSAVGQHPPGQSDDTMEKAREMAGQAKGFADDTASRASGLADEARERVGEYSAQAGQMARQAGETLSQAGSQAYRQGQQATDYIGERVREEPMLALLGAGALGFALGLLIARR